MHHLELVAIQVNRDRIWGNGTAENLNCRSGGIFALVPFARADLAH